MAPGGRAVTSWTTMISMSPAIRRLHTATGLWLCLALMLAGATCAGSAAAAPARDGLVDMHHTAWRVADGVPGHVSSLAQTPDGWLWVGTHAGLFRFDGVRFHRVDVLGGTRLPSATISSLAAMPNGELWIGHLYGGASRFHDGVLTHYGEKQGLPPGSPVDFVYDHDAALWLSTTRGLYRFDGTRWKLFGDTLPMCSLRVDRHGTLWALTRRGDVLAKQRDEPTFRRIGNAGETTSSSLLTEGPDGDMWLAGPDGLVRFNLQGRQPLGRSIPRDVEDAPLLFDHQGMAWLMTERGLLRVDPRPWSDLDAPATPPAAPFGVAQGVNFKQVFRSLEDREGNVWLGTLEGLERFSPSRLRRLIRPDGTKTGVAALAAGAGAEVWIGELSALPMRIGNEWRTVGLPETGTLAMHVDSSGVGWVAELRGRLWRVDGVSATEVARPPSALPGRVNALVRDRAGRLWISMKSEARRGIHRQDGDGWTWLSQSGALPADSALSLHVDPQGRVWAGFTDSRLCVFEDDTPRCHGSAEGLAIGNVLSLASGRNGLWAGGDSGVAVFRNGRFHSLVGAGNTTFHGVSGVALSASGELWLNSAEGIVRFAADQLALVEARPDHQPQFELFDHRDGLEGIASQVNFIPTAAATSDGKLWFSTTAGVWWIDPAQITRNTVPPSVFVTSMKVSGQSRPVEGDISLPAQPASLEIDYTATSLAMPDRVRFRYRLDGVDADWQDAGTRRTAYYTRLGPGKHRFEVIASNAEGVWSATPATLEFRIEPALHQTLWFRALAVAAVVALAIGAVVVRVRHVVARAAERLQARMAERERIAGELHDTLLQAVHGLLLRMHVVFDRLSDDGARQALSKAVDDAERLVSEGRDRIAGLREDTPPADELPQALQRMVHALCDEAPVRASVRTVGTPHRLRPEVAEEVLLIAREAVLNAVRHAGATALTVSLRFAGDTLELVVKDDGRGIEQDILDARSAAGHWGLRGMHERAGRIAAALSVQRGEGGGTEVVLRVGRR
jgi:signal transduction histidine kinase/ligand-binding sensor domain-containing protein